MKNGQQMSVEISTQNDLALKPLSSAVKDEKMSAVSPIEHVVMDGNFNNYLPENNDEENKTSATSIVKIEVSELRVECKDDKEEEPVSNGISDVKIEDTALKDEEVKIMSETENCDDKSNIEVIKEESVEDEKKSEMANEELLEDQIMDTEHLLQIVDKEEEDAEDTKDSCSSNSEISPDKSDDAEVEGERNGNTEDESKADSNKDDGIVEFEDTIICKDEFDKDLEREYKKMLDEGKKNVATVEPKETAENNLSNGLEEDEGASSESSSKTSKRSLEEADSENDSKKSKISEGDNNADKCTEEKTKSVRSTTKVDSLNIISEFMQNRFLKFLSREHLEEICLIKICEAIGYRSEIGELRHQIGVQEQMVEMWRKETVQLAKQTRDLEIVNKRLLHEVRLRGDNRDKPIIPVKITRSVGLQVRSDNNVMLPQKRRFSRTQSTTTSPLAKPTRFVPSKVMPPANPPSNVNNNKPPPNKVPISRCTPPQPVPKPKPLLPKSSPSSLLSKALQNSALQSTIGSTSAMTNSSHTSVNNSSLSNNSSSLSTSNVYKSTPAPTPKPVKSVEPKVIDLTDEDDKKPVQMSSSGATSAPLQGGVRIVSTPVKTANVVSSTGVVNPPRIMYVYNNQIHQSIITDSSKIGTQKLMLKLNPNVIGQTNGVIATVSNAAPIAVTTANIRTNQVQPVRLSTPMATVRTSSTTKLPVLKHPAPLPPPPVTQMGIAARKPIPPKPHLSIRRSSGGIVLSWKMPYNLDNYESIASYQLYAYQETTSAPSSDMWRKVGDVKALALPMACTLTQFADGNKYHFAVRAVDVQKRMGPFSEPEQILL